MRRKRDTNDILAVSAKVFSSKGYTKATLEEIGAGLNMTNSNFYSYYKSKDELYRATLENELEKWLKHVVDVMVKVNIEGVDKLVELLGQTVKYLAAADALWGMIKNCQTSHVSLGISKEVFNVYADRYNFVLNQAIASALDQGTLNDADTEYLGLYIKRLLALFIENRIKDHTQEEALKGIPSLLNYMLYGVIKR